MIENGNGMHGHEKGALGAGVTPGARSALRFLQAELGRSSNLAETVTADTVRFALSVREDPSASYRDRIRASELIEAMVKRGVDIALYLDKADRVESGQPTEVVEHREMRVEFDRMG